MTSLRRAVVLYRDSALRRRALADASAPERYALYGLDMLDDVGIATSHNLEAGREPTRVDRALAGLYRRRVRRRDGYGGDFASVLAVREEIAVADVVVSTVDTLGIPLALLRRGRLLAATPVVYVSIGLLDRVRRLTSNRAIEELREAVADSRLVLAYGHAEAEELRGWLGPLVDIRFVPFGVDTSAFAPGCKQPDLDVVSVGSDPHRDWPLLLELARRLPMLGFRVVAGEAGYDQFAIAPANLTVSYDEPLTVVRDLLQRARVVVLPVLDNDYSGATTTLLQAMACGRPVVVTRTRAIAAGYGLADGQNCVLVPPGEAMPLEQAVRGLLDRPDEAEQLGRRARDHAAMELGWERYAQAMAQAVADVAGA